MYKTKKMRNAKFCFTPNFHQERFGERFNEPQAAVKADDIVDTTKTTTPIILLKDSETKYPKQCTG